MSQLTWPVRIPRPPRIVPQPGLARSKLPVGSPPWVTLVSGDQVVSLHTPHTHPSAEEMPAKTVMTIHGTVWPLLCPVQQRNSALSSWETGKPVQSSCILLDPLGGWTSFLGAPHCLQTVQVSGMDWKPESQEHTAGSQQVNQQAASPEIGSCVFGAHRGSRALGQPERLQWPIQSKWA